MSPFVSVVAWGLVIAIPPYTTDQKRTVLPGGRTKSSSALVGLVILLTPTWVLTDSSVEGLRAVAENVPMLVILIGAIALAPGYQLLIAWMVSTDDVAAEADKGTSS